MKKIFQALKKEWPIVLIVLLALFFRLYRISSYMTFLGDEGRDALVWLRMLHGKFTLIGPQTSIGNMYLGPLYYYLMFPFYIFLGTIGPSVGVALFAGVTTFLLWLFGREWFSEKVGLIAAFLYAISPVAIILSRSSWNPNVMPFFSLLIIWGVWQFWQKDKYYWLAIDGVLLSFAVQSHYLGLLLIPVIWFFFLIKLISLLRKKDQRWKKLSINFLLLNTCFLILTFLPLVWFDLRHNFINAKAFYRFFSERQTTVNLKPYKAIPAVLPLWQTLFGRLILGVDVSWGKILALIFVIGGILISLKKIDLFENNDSRKMFKLILFWLGFGLLGMGLYKQHIYDHYFGFLYPAVFLFVAIVLGVFWKLNLYGKLFTAISLITIIVFCCFRSPLKSQPNNQMMRTREVSQKIIQESSGQPFNIGLIARQNYDAGYRYFLEKSGHKAVEIDALRSKETITSQLFVVCEEKECLPTTHPQAEIANFGWTKIEKEWNFPWGTKLFKLVHNK